jgi:hypothetical protein
MPKSILDPTFKYTNAVATDIRVLFARVRAEQAEKASPAQRQLHTVTKIRRS